MSLIDPCTEGALHIWSSSLPCGRGCWLPLWHCSPSTLDPARGALQDQVCVGKGMENKQVKGREGVGGPERSYIVPHPNPQTFLRKDNITLGCIIDNIRYIIFYYIIFNPSCPGSSSGESLLVQPQWSCSARDQKG